MTENLAYISTPPGASNVDRLYASFENAGKGVTAYWIDSELYTPNKDLVRQNLVLGRLQTADFPRRKRWSEAANDHGGCMLSLATGSRYGVARNADYRAVASSSGPAPSSAASKQSLATYPPAFPHLYRGWSQSHLPPLGDMSAPD